jgi:hypothetical protein
MSVNAARNEIMKFLCLSYIDEQKFDVMTESERATFFKDCVAYDETLKRNGHFLRLEGLQSARNAKTVRCATTRSPSPTARSLKPRSKSAAFSCSIPEIWTTRPN